MRFSEYFFQAVCDYRYLLESDYPLKSILKLVGDRYALPSHERVMLYRGLAKKQQVMIRQQKLIQDIPVHAEVTLDGFNVCRTVGSYLNGNPVFVGMDGYLRDVSELHRKKLKWEVLEKSIRLILEFLREKDISHVHFYFDTPISHSGKMCLMTRQKMQEMNIAGAAQTVFSPDHELITAENGFICTADSNIIENTKVKVFDLAHHLLQDKFSAQLFSFPEFLVNKKCPERL
ncbi:MAG: hypothetical protein IEMM0006_0654 [bacterium]|nr:MAG: hypothetical protein IEMM0006_0654 [bacterium]